MRNSETPQESGVSEVTDGETDPRERLVSRPESDWAAAGQELRDLLDRGTPSKHYLIARALDWSPAKLSRTLTGDRCPTLDECQELQRFLDVSLAEERPGPVDRLWYLEAPPTGILPISDRPQSKGASTQSRRRTVVLAAALAIAVSVVVVGLLSESDSRSEPFLPSQECPVAVGQALEADVMAFTGAVVDAYRSSGALAVIGCPSARMALWGTAARQDFETDDGVRSVIIAATPDSAVALPPALWQSYRRIRGAMTPELAGHPRAINFDQKHVEVPLTLGGALVAEGPQAPHFWLHPLLFEAWMTHRDVLGLPVSNAYIEGSALQQDFTSGSLVISGPSVTDIPVVPVDMTMLAESVVERKTTEPVPPSVDPGLLVTQADGTNWLIDPNGSRLWVINRTVLECLGLVPTAELRGADLALLPYAGLATCDV